MANPTPVNQDKRLSRSKHIQCIGVYSLAWTGFIYFMSFLNGNGLDLSFSTLWKSLFLGTLAGVGLHLVFYKSGHYQKDSKADEVRRD